MSNNPNRKSKRATDGLYLQVNTQEQRIYYTEAR